MSDSEDDDKCPPCSFRAGDYVPGFGYAQEITLSEEGWERLMEILNAPPQPPNERLRAVMREAGLVTKVTPKALEQIVESLAEPDPEPTPGFVAMMGDLPDVKIVLAEEAFDAFVEGLDDPPEPTPTLLEMIAEEE